MINYTFLVTGGCGFVGSNLAILFKLKYPRATIIALDNLKRQGSELNIKRLKDLFLSNEHHAEITFFFALVLIANTRYLTFMLFFK